MNINQFHLMLQPYDLQQCINNAPDWVCWVAQDENGTWVGFDNRPVIGLIPSGLENNPSMYECWMYDETNGVHEITELKLLKDKPNPNWKVTCKRVRRFKPNER